MAFPRTVVGALALLLAVALLWTVLPGTSRAGQDTRSNRGPIVFFLTPQGVKDGRFRVDVRVDTHSGDLSRLDLQSATVLRLGTREYPALTPVSLGGHHGTGTLWFGLGEAPRAFEIVIRGVGTQGALSFRWP
jgi:hypothetical protein